MIALNAADNLLLAGPPVTDSLILRLTQDPDCPASLRPRSALLCTALPAVLPEGFGSILLKGHATLPIGEGVRVVSLSPQLGYLAEGDVIRIVSDLRISALYRRRANANFLLVTERCNSFCVMCSQPPRKIDDSYLVKDLLQAIPLFDRGTHEIGITGGEPTLLGDSLFDLLRQLKSHLPETAVHMLSNGRNFKDPALAQRIASVHHPDLMVGIPLYSDIAAIHDFVVQADHAFDETIAGILNLKRHGVRVEIRVVIHRETYARLPELAEFIARNLLFVDHVALMGLEITGFAKTNLDALWIDPIEYQPQLRAAAEHLVANRIRTSIYNHQLCLLDPAIRHLAVKSISDWKNEYMPECSGCDLMHDCGGFFSSARSCYSPNIRAQRRLA
jgi:His-Xaa-Ser system radical SAM maturase HxsC